MRLRRTEPAVRDLQSICDYAGEHNGPAAARRIAIRIYDGLNSLPQFPRKGRIGRRLGTRELIISGLPWLSVYRIREDDDAEIIHLISARKAVKYEAQIYTAAHS